MNNADLGNEYMSPFENGPSPLKGKLLELWTTLRLSYASNDLFSTAVTFADIITEIAVTHGSEADTPLQGQVDYLLHAGIIASKLEWLTNFLIGKCPRFSLDDKPIWKQDARDMVALVDAMLLTVWSPHNRF